MCGPQFLQTTVRHTTSSSREIIHDPIVNDKTHRKAAKTRRKCAYPAARNINGSCSCIRAQAQRVLDTCCGSNSWIRRWVWMETISTQGPFAAITLEEWEFVG